METHNVTSKIFGRIKGFTHNVCADVRYTLVLVLCILVIVKRILAGDVSITDLFVAFILCILAVIVFSLFLVRLLYINHTNRNLKFFKCFKSILFKNCVWINMSVKREKDKDKKDLNRQWTFMDEMKKILRKIPKGYTVYCTTHQEIVDVILYKYPDAEVTKAYKKDLNGLKKKLLSKEEREQLRKSKKKDIQQFYAVKFVK